MSDRWLWATAADLGRGIARGDVDARDLAEVYLDAIETHPDAGRIYARTMADTARAEADASRARARASVRRGPLDGVPVSWKDLFDSAGIATESGSALLKGRTPTTDAVLLARARRAGIVSLGKTHQTELAFSGLGINPVTATPPNVNDPEAAPGGSSSGAATSVAFGLAAAGIGSDTGGSVRTPAAWNDLVGLKTTHGLLPLEGVVPLCPKFDTAGPLCRSVEDAALLLGMLAASPATDLAGASLRGTRLLVLDTTGLGETSPDQAKAFAAAIACLEQAGARLEHRALAAIAAVFETAAVVFAAEAYGIWGETIEAHPDLMFPPVRERFRSGATPTAAHYVRAWTRIEALRRDYAAATAGFDAVLTPTTPNMPPSVAALLADHARFNAENLAALRHTRIANLMGLPALTLPTGVPSCGLMASGTPFGEARLLRLGAAIEAALA